MRLSSAVGTASTFVDGSAAASTSSPSSATLAANVLTSTTTRSAPLTVTSTAAGSVAASTAPPSLVVEGRLGESVRGFFAARDAANAAPSPNPDSAALADAATGEALQIVRDETARRRDEGQAIRAGTAGLARIGVGFVTVTGASAMVAVCSIDDEIIYEMASNRVVSDAVMTHSYQVDLAHNGARWMVARVVRIQEWQGVAGCARSFDDFPY